MTAESAVVIPALAVLVAMLLWGVLTTASHIRCVDAARAGARAAARGESTQVVREAVRETAPRGARVRTSRDGGMVRVQVEVNAAGPGALSVNLRGEAVAWDETSPKTSENPEEPSRPA